MDFLYDSCSDQLSSGEQLSLLIFYLLQVTL